MLTLPPTLRRHLTSPPSATQVLYSDSLRQACAPPSLDVAFYAFSATVMVLFALEAGLTVLASPAYAKRCARGGEGGSARGGWIGELALPTATTLKPPSTHPLTHPMQLLLRG